MRTIIDDVIAEYKSKHGNPPDVIVLTAEKLKQIIDTSVTSLRYSNVKLVIVEKNDEEIKAQ